ncbi:MAG: YidC/Oxa1 family membrane protein insertase [Acidimicrobiia bacterium]
MGSIDFSILQNQRVPILGHLFGLFELLIGWLLAAIYSVVPSYGLAIIILTIFIRVLLYPVTAKGTRSMASMQKLQPEIKRLQAKYKSDRQRLNEELMALYKANNVNPAMGCLPLLAQMPVMIALYSVFRPRPGQEGIPISFLPHNSSLVADICGGSPVLSDSGAYVCESAQNPAVSQFLGMNLTESPSRALSSGGFVHFIPYLVILLLIVATGYLSQRQLMKRNQNTAQSTPQAMQTVTKLMPAFFAVISFSLPAAVNLYFLTTNTFQIFQQWFMFRSTKDEDVVIPKSPSKSKSATSASGDKSPGRTGSAAPKGQRKASTGRTGTDKGAGGAKPARVQKQPKSGTAATGGKKPPQKVAPKSKRSGNSGNGTSNKGTKPKPQGN